MSPTEAHSGVFRTTVDTHRTRNVITDYRYPMPRVQDPASTQRYVWHSGSGKVVTLRVEEFEFAERSGGHFRRYQLAIDAVVVQISRVVNKAPATVRYVTDEGTLTVTPQAAFWADQPLTSID